MAHICESPNFIWLKNKCLGRGATAMVYEGMDKRNGDMVAVKCYNEYITHPEEQLREFEVLQKINHENIVKFIGIENNLLDSRKVIIMELCRGGNLYDEISDPKNFFGLKEPEFLLILKHLCSGMKYLRDNNIIHRDIKPGNIMKCIQDDGSTVYKLTDFGAAKELKDDESFHSIHGTKHYLHPDVYKRAVLGKPEDRKFNSLVDLWSIGVTLYHIATSTLPFEVCPGYKAAETFYNVITQRASGVISGIQTKPSGPIVWSQELPKNCLLSENLKKIVTPLIAGLLEADYSKIWNFDKFFRETDIISSYIPIDIFYVNKSKLIKLYLLPDQIYIDLQQHIKDQMEIELSDQFVLYKGDLFKRLIQESTKVHEYPITSENSPLFLFNKRTVLFSSTPVNIPQWVDFPINISVENDIGHANCACVIAHLCVREIAKYTLKCKLIHDSVENFVDYINKCINTAQLKTQHLFEKLCIFKKPVQALQLLENGNSNYDKLKYISTEFATVTALEVTNLYNIQCVENSLRLNWATEIMDLKCPFKTNALRRAETQVAELRKSWEYLRKQPININVTYNECHLHILERKKVRQRIHNTTALLEKEILPQFEQLAKKFEIWLGSAQNTHCKIHILQADIEQYEKKLKDFENELTIEYSSQIKNRSQKLDILSKSHIKKRLQDYSKNKEKTDEILEENTRLMNQMQDFTKCLEP